MPFQLELHGDRDVRIVEVPSRPPGPGEVQVEGVLSGISTGTELRHFRAAAGERPVRPGYEFVGRVAEANGDEDLLGALVWLDRPHASEALASSEEARAGRLPTGSAAPLSRFSFLARTRTALNAVHDSELRIGERVLVVGLGAVGALVARIAVLAGAEAVFACDPVPARRELAARWGAEALAPEQVEAAEVDADVVFEVSGDPAGLAIATGCCGDHSRVVVVSTYEDPAGALLPGQGWAVRQPAFVFSTTRPGTRPRGEPRWSHSRLLDQARRLLGDGQIAAEDLVTQTFPLDRAAAAYEALEGPVDGQLCGVLAYG